MGVCGGAERRANYFACEASMKIVKRFSEHQRRNWIELNWMNASHPSFPAILIDDDDAMQTKSRDGTEMVLGGLGLAFG